MQLILETWWYFHIGNNYYWTEEISREKGDQNFVKLVSAIGGHICSRRPLHINWKPRLGFVWRALRGHCINIVIFTHASFVLHIITYSSLVWVLACHQFSAKPLLKQILIYCHDMCKNCNKMIAKNKITLIWYFNQISFVMEILHEMWLVCIGAAGHVDWPA